MVSTIDPTVPDGAQAFGADLRANLLAAKNEIEGLQAGSGIASGALLGRQLKGSKQISLASADYEIQANDPLHLLFSSPPDGSRAIYLGAAPSGQHKIYLIVNVDPTFSVAVHQGTIAAPGAFVQNAQPKTAIVVGYEGAQWRAGDRLVTLEFFQNRPTVAAEATDKVWFLDADGFPKLSAIQDLPVVGGGGGGGLTTSDDANAAITFDDNLAGTHRNLTGGSQQTITLADNASVGTRIAATPRGAGGPAVVQVGGTATYLLEGDTTGRDTSFLLTGYGEFESRGSGVWHFYGQSDHGDLADNDLDMAGQQITNAKTPYPASEITASRSLTLADANQKKLVGNHATIAIDLTVEPDSTTDFPDGTAIPIARKGAAAVNIVAGSGVTVNKPSDKQLSLRAQYSEGVLWKETTNIWWFTGDQTPV